MSIARSITNHYPDFRLLEMSKTTVHPDRRGPYMVVQDGADPGDPESRECTFVLTRRGTWLHFYVFLVMPSTVRQEAALFDGVPEVMSLVEGLEGKPKVETLNTLPQLLQRAGFVPTADDPIAETLLAEVSRKRGPIRPSADPTFTPVTT